MALRRFISGAQYRVQADPTDRLSLHLVGAKLHIVITIRQTNDLIRVDAAIKPVSDGHEDRLPAGAAAESWRSLRPPFFERIPVPSELAPSSRIDQVVLAFDDPWAPVAVFREDVNLEKAVTARSGTSDDLHAQKSLRVLFDKVMQATLASKRRALNLTGGFVDSDRLRLYDCPSVRSARSYMTRAVKLSGGWHSRHMTSQTPNYHGYRFPPEIISHAVWLYHRFCLSFRDAEDLLAQRGVTVTYETIRHWCHAFGPDYARRLRRGRGRMGDTWYLDELFVNIQGRRQYLWRAVDQDGDLIDILVQSRRDRHAATRFFRKLLKGQGREPRRLVTDKLRSYAAAHRTVMPSVMHSTQQYENNRAEVSHQPSRQRERQMRRFTSAAQAQRFLSVHGVVLNLVRVGRHLLRAIHHRLSRTRAFGVWREVTCV